MESFETYRPFLFSIAYRMLGSVMEAEDMAQETFVRVQNVAPETLQSPKAFLTTVITRLCINRLESARQQRETYIGPWLPEPVLTDEKATAAPTEEAILHESISYAFLVLLETLSPLERAVFLLHEVFDYDYNEIAEIIGKEEAACRQLFSRAKKHIAEHRPRFKPNEQQHRQLLNKFLNAAEAGELEGLMTLLADDVTMWADGGGKARGAATRPVQGREAVARFLQASTKLAQSAFYAEIAQVNEEAAVVLRTRDKPLLVLFIEGEKGQIHNIRVVGNPDKLHGI